MTNIQVIPMLVPVDDDGTLIKQHLISRLRPDWMPQDVVCVPIKGGFVNVMKLFHHKSDVDKRDGLVVRIFQSAAEGWVSRENEFAGMQLAHQAGCFPATLASFSNGLVYEYAPGRNLQQHELEDPVIGRAIARCLAQFHTYDVTKESLINADGTSTSFPAKCAFFHRFRKMIDDFESAKFDQELERRVKKEQLDASVLRHEWDYIEATLSEIHLPVGLTHGDLHARNIVYDEGTDRVSLVDFEGLVYGLCAFDFVYFFNINLYKCSLPESFPALDRPVTEEVRALWIQAYMKHIFELEGRNPTEVTQKDIDVKTLEIRILDAITPLIFVISELCMFENLGEKIIFKIFPGCMKAYYERKVNLKQLCEEYARRKSGQ